MKSRLIEGAVIVLAICTASSLAAEPPRRPVISGMGGMGGGMGSMGGAIPSDSSRLDGPTEGQRPLAELLRCLKSKDLTTRRKAALGLYWKSPPRDPAAIPPLIEALRDQNAEIRGNIARALGSYGPQAKAAVPALLEIVKNIEDAARFDAVSAIGEIGPEARGAVPILIEMLEEKHYLAREAAATALGKIGREARPAIKRLRKAMGDYAPPVRVVAAAALWRIRGSAQESVPVLISVLQDTDAPDEMEIAILEIGRDFDIPTLPRRSKKGSRPGILSMDSPRRHAAELLGEMGRDARAAVPALRKVAKQDSGWIQLGAASALMRISPHTVEIVPAIRAAMRDEDWLLRVQAIRRLDQLGGKDRTDLLPLFIEAMSDKDESVQFRAAVALRKFGPAAKKAVPSLLLALQSDGTLRFAAASTLQAIGPEAKTIVPQLISLLKSGNAEMRGLAAHILAEIGRDASDAMPILVKSLRDSDKYVREAAGHALRKIDPSAMQKKDGAR